MIQSKKRGTPPVFDGSGGRLRHDGFERCKRAVGVSADAVASSLCRQAMDAFKAWVEAARPDDPEAAVRVAVVRSGFCEGDRGMASRWARRAFDHAIHVKTRYLTSDFFKRLERRTVLVVDDVDGASTLVDVLLNVVNAGTVAGVVVIAPADWTLPGSLPTAVASRIMARDFNLPPFDDFVNAFLDRLVSHDVPIVIGPNVMNFLLDDMKRTRDVRRFVSLVDYALFVYFARTPASFVAVADSLPVAVAEIDEGSLHKLNSLRGESISEQDLLPMASTALFWRQLATCAVVIAETSLRFAQACDTDRCWRLAVSIFERDSSMTAARAVKRALHTTKDIQGLLHLWTRIVRTHLPLRDDASSNAGGHVRLVRCFATRVLQLEAIARKIHEEASRRAQLELAAVQLYLVLADEAAKIRHLPLGEVVYFDDAATVAKPFEGKMWSETINALATSDADVRCLAFQVAADNPNLDVATWYALLDERVRGTPLYCEDEEDRSCQFVTAVRDLVHAGLIRDHAKRGKYLVVH